MPNITTEELVDVVSGIRGTTPVSIITRTTPNMRKAANPYLLCKKLAIRSGFLGVNYENKVNRQRRKELNFAPFIVEDLWAGAGEHINSYIVRHRFLGDRYLVFYPMKIIQELYLNTHGQEIPVANIRPYLRSQPAAPKQETEQQIFWRVIKLNNIELLRMNKTAYTIVN